MLLKSHFHLGFLTCQFFLNESGVSNQIQICNNVTMAGNGQELARIDEAGNEVEEAVDDQGEQVRVPRALTRSSRIIRAIFLFWLDVVLLICFVPRGSKVTLRMICIILARTVVYAIVMVAQYGVYGLLLVDRGVAPQSDFTLYIDRILGLPANCGSKVRQRRSTAGWEDFMAGLQQEEDPTIDPVLKNLDLMKEKETQDSGPSFYDFEDDYEGPENFSENVFSNLTSTTTEVPMKAKNLDLLGFSRKDIQVLGYVLCLALTLLLLVLVITNFVILKVYKNKAARAEKDLEIRKKNDLEKIDVETAEF